MNILAVKRIHNEVLHLKPSYKGINSHSVLLTFAESVLKSRNMDTLMIIIFIVQVAVLLDRNVFLADGAGEAASEDHTDELQPNKQTLSNVASE